MCHHQENPPRTDWNEEARRQANMYPNLDEFLRRLMPENQSEFLREFFNNANVQSENEPNIRPSNDPTTSPKPQCTPRLLGPKSKNCLEKRQSYQVV